MSFENANEGFPVSAIKEIKILRGLKHKNIVQIIDIAAAKNTTRDPFTQMQKLPYSFPYNFFMVLEYMEHSLSGLIDRRFQFNQIQIRIVISQILEGLAFLHEHHIMHRDLKCSNVLVNSSGAIKIADFGMATLFNSQIPLKNSKGIATLWYKAPELLNRQEYTEAIDLWAVGCILGELLSGSPVFKGYSEEEQLFKISSCLGVALPPNHPHPQTVSKSCLPFSDSSLTLKERFSKERM